MQMLLVIAAFVLASIGVSAIVFFAARFRRWEAMGQMIQRRFGYGVSKPWLLEMVVSASPRFRFLYRGIPCYLKSRNVGFLQPKPTKITFAVDWPSRATAWLISTDETQKGRWLESPMVLPEASTFHQRFFLYVRDKKKVTHLITPPVQHALVQMLAKMRSSQPENHSTAGECLTLRSSRGRLTFATTAAWSDPREVEKFMRCCLHIYDLMVLGAVEGLTYIEDDLTVIEDIVCPICSGAIEGDYVSCSSCQSPHCRDCWQYNGRCATFACMETDFEVHPTPATRLPLAQFVDSVN